MRIRVLPTTAGRCLLVIDRVEWQISQDGLKEMLDRPRPSVDGVLVTNEDVELPALESGPWPDRGAVSDVDAAGQ